MKDVPVCKSYLHVYANKHQCIVCVCVCGRGGGGGKSI